MSTAITLSKEELAIIESRRVEEAQAHQKQMQEFEESVLRHKRARDAKMKMAYALYDLAPDLVSIREITTIKSTDCGLVEKSEVSVKILVTGEYIDICYHIVYNGSGYFSRGHNKGLRYEFGCKINDYRTKYIKRPQTIVRNIQDYLEKCERVDQEQKIERELEKRATQEINKLFPNAVIVHNEKSVIKKSLYTVTLPAYFEVKNNGKSMQVRYYEQNGDIVFAYQKISCDSDHNKDWFDVCVKFMNS